MLRTPQSASQTVSIYQGRMTGMQVPSPPKPPSTGAVFPTGASASSFGLPRLSEQMTHAMQQAQQHLPQAPVDNSDKAVGGALGLLRQRDTGNSPSRARQATQLSSSYKELPVTPSIAQPSFSATGPVAGTFPAPRSAGVAKRTFSRGTGTVVSSIDSALAGGGMSASIAHAIAHKDNLVPPLYVPPIEVATTSTPIGSSQTAESLANSDGVNIVSPTNKAAPPPPPPLAPRAAVTVVFDLDETLCNNRRPGKALLRPHCMELLHHLNALRNDPTVNCYVEIILWTASMECVARPVVERLDPTGNLFQHLIYRDRRWYKETGYTKDLKKLGREMHHTVIIENSPASVHLNRKHSILVRDFVSGQDGELIVVKEILDGWIRQCGQCAKTMGGPPPNEPHSPSSIAKFLSDHPCVNSGNEVIHKMTSTPLDATKSPLRSNSLGLSVSRFAINRPTLYPAGRR